MLGGVIVQTVMGSRTVSSQKMSGKVSPKCKKSFRLPLIDILKTKITQFKVINCSCLLGMKI